MELKAINSLTTNVLGVVSTSMDKFKSASEIEVITTEDQEREVIDFTKAIRQSIKHVDTERLAYVSGATKWVRDANAVFKPVTDKLKKLKDLIDGRLKDYQFKLEKEMLIKNEKILAAQEAENKKNREDAPFIHDDGSPPIDMPARVIETPKTKHTDSSSATYKPVTKWTVKNFMLVPRGYLALDHEAINLAIKGGEEIPGIETHEEKILTIR